jgi:hypothetical protein
MYIKWIECPPFWDFALLILTISVKRHHAHQVFSLLTLSGVFAESSSPGVVGREGMSPWSLFTYPVWGLCWELLPWGGWEGVNVPLVLVYLPCQGSLLRAPPLGWLGGRECPLGPLPPPIPPQTLDLCSMTLKKGIFIYDDWTSVYNGWTSV